LLWFVISKDGVNTLEKMEVNVELGLPFEGNLGEALLAT
jgi:hypothetical protein